MRKGFTLVELLAVIVVLAIILFIAIPRIFDVVEDSRVATFEINAKMVLRSLELDRFSLDPTAAGEITKEYLATKLKINVENIGSIRLALMNNNIAMEMIGTKVWEGYVAYGILQSMTIDKVENYDGNFIPPFTISFNPNTNVSYSNSEEIEVLIDSLRGLDETSLKYIWWNDGSSPEIADFELSFNVDELINFPENVSDTRYLCIYARDIDENEIVDCSDRFFVDTEKPIISIIGEERIVLNINDPYTDSGATAFDSREGDLTSNIVAINNLNTSIAGSYTVSYNVEDSAGNQADEITREICVLPSNFEINISTIGAHSVEVPCDAEYVVELRGARGGNGGPKGQYGGGSHVPESGYPGSILIGEMFLSSSDTINVTIGSMGSTGGQGGNSGGGGGGGGGGGSTSLTVNSTLTARARGGNGGKGSNSQYNGGGGTGGARGTPDGVNGSRFAYGNTGGAGGAGGGTNLTIPAFTQTSLTATNSTSGRIVITLKP